MANESKTACEAGVVKHPEQALTDSPKQAVESGEPRLTGRTHEGILNDDGRANPGARDEVTGRKSTDEGNAPESGRHGESRS
jgi:hypothetical protein